MLPLRLPYALIFSCATAMSGAHAATAWDEAASGDLSNSGLTPTPLTLVVGANLVSGATGRVSGVVDRDYFSFTLPAGHQLDSLTLLPGSNALGGSGLTFIGVQTGAQMTVSPTGGSATGLLGWWHYSTNEIGTDILPLIGQGLGAIGFVDALPAGSYTFWVQDTGTGVANYRYELSVSAVPEPAGIFLLMAGAMALAGRVRYSRI